MTASGDYYLTLGDGDFSYSLDLCRFLAAYESLEAVKKNKKKKSGQRRRSDNGSCGDHHGDNDVDKKEHEEEHNTIQIVCTGIDSFEELKRKYHDAPFTLKKIASLDGPVPVLTRRISSTSTTNIPVPPPKTQPKTTISVGSQLSISAHHCVNAIDAESFQYVSNSEPASSTATTMSIQPEPLLPMNTKYKHVIFNHPHIGVEDAVRHSRFISHFFHTANHVWLSNKRPNAGVLHLTLVMGQFERWKCMDAAKKHGFIILDRSAFQPPPPPGVYIQEYFRKLKQQQKINNDVDNGNDNDITVKLEAFQSENDFKRRFQTRRHQSGRSFSSRTEEGSETITFGRKEDIGFHAATQLPWQNMTFNTKINNLETANNQERKFVCPHCSKNFLDNRGLKNHIKCVHDVNSNNNQTTRKSHALDIVCEVCTGDAMKKRVFANDEALRAHKKAKHFGQNTDIKPNWAAAAASNNTPQSKDGHEITLQEPCGKCDICDFIFYTNDDKVKHSMDFIPTISTGDLVDSFSCTKCKKKFCSERARLQHENFCSFIEPLTKDGTGIINGPVLNM
jgi:hypothetical protein